ncbi:MAG TPA: cardiolipin synthase [Thermoanaerobaculia bacterium]|nr:cardiolipin synthase [Thermoanaerobaculia bacterium]
MAHKNDKTFEITRRKGTTYIRVPLALAVSVVVVLSLLSLLLWSAKWKRDPATLTVRDPGDLQVMLPSMAGVTQGELDPGNRVEVLQNGDGFFPRLFADIGAARENVHIETFIWRDGELARRLAALLGQKAREGVEVRLLVDAFGGRQVRKVEERLRESGVVVAKFHPIRLSNLGRLNNRDHRKLMIIDGRIGYVAGHGIGDEWMGNAGNKAQYRDTALRIEGPAVRRLQGAFSENWIEERGEILAGETYFPADIPAAGASTVHVAYASPTGSSSTVQILYYLAIVSARREVIIQNPYLLPDRDALRAIEDARSRGVEILIMVPSVSATDNALVQHASHHRFGHLLARGVRIWEYDKTLLHQKVMVVDGAWASVGSTNFDDRSFEINDEISVGVLDSEVAGQLRAAFFDDLRFARERRLDEWRRRSLWHKLKDGLAYLAHDQL